MRRECNGAKHGTEATEVEYTIRKLIRIDKWRLGMPEENKRNGFAVAGFVLSLSGMILTIVGWILIIYFMGHVFELFMTEMSKFSTESFMNMNPEEFINPEIWPSAMIVFLACLLSSKIPGVLGIVFSSVGIAKAGEGFGGKKMAIAGLVLGIIAFLT